MDLESLRDPRGKRIEARAADFRDLTYPTGDIRYVVQDLNERFSTRTQTAGLFLFEGYKGTGKSHLLLFIHHLITNPEYAVEWLKRYEMECAIPEDVVVITQKFTDFPLFDSRLSGTMLAISCETRYRPSNARGSREVS